MKTSENPGDYYRDKAKEAGRLWEVVQMMKLIQREHASFGPAWYATIMRTLEQALEQARYVGD